MDKAKQLFQEFLGCFQKMDEDSRCNLEDVLSQKSVLEAFFASSK